jgi:hypothetical protein
VLRIPSLPCPSEREGVLMKATKQLCSAELVYSPRKLGRDRPATRTPLLTQVNWDKTEGLASPV